VPTWLAVLLVIVALAIVGIVMWLGADRLSNRQSNTSIPLTLSQMVRLLPAIPPTRKVSYGKAFRVMSFRNADQPLTAAVTGGLNCDSGSYQGAFERAVLRGPGAIAGPRLPDQPRRRTVKTGIRCPEQVMLDSYSNLRCRLFGICWVELLNLGGIVDFGHQIRKAYR
jgi:hypothetical protein